MADYGFYYAVGCEKIVLILIILVTPVVTAIGIRRMQSTDNVCPR